MSIINEAVAAEVATDVATQGAALPGPIMQLVPLALIFIVFYFFLIRPQIKKQKEVQNMISALKKGDRVITSGGIVGVIHKVEDGFFDLEIAKDVYIKVTKGSVTMNMASNAPVHHSSAKEVVAEKKTNKVVQKKKNA